MLFENEIFKTKSPFSEIFQTSQYLGKALFSGFLSFPFRVLSRTKSSIKVRAGHDLMTLRIKLNPYREEENEGGEYVNVGAGTTVENWVSANDITNN